MASKKKILIGGMDSHEYLWSIFSVASRLYNFEFVIEVEREEHVGGELVDFYTVHTRFPVEDGPPIPLHYSVSSTILNARIMVGVSTLDRVKTWAESQRAVLGP